MSEAIKIGTHSGNFHCDEVLAIFLLKQLPKYKNASIVRSREISILNTCDIVVDVGGKYDHATKRYDHHMKDFKETANTVLNTNEYDPKIKLSSAGLIYCHYGHEILKNVITEVISDSDIDIIFKKIYNSLIKEIDATDNGLPMCDGEPAYRIVTGLSSRVARFNPRWNQKGQDENIQFSKAVEYVGEEFMEFVQYNVNIWLPARTIVKNAIEKRFEVDPSGEIILLEPFCPWTEHLFDLEKELNIETPLKYVIFENTNFNVQCVPVAPGSFICRLFLPEAWAGLREEALVKACGIDNAVFVHAVRFIGVNKTKEGILEMARKSLQTGKSQ
ncbi:MYG1 protein C27H6.8 [Prorops nasuta]|uniref:MYG1 protein C27H6.8 n=1 Tax=Prorops nasuta TaxID=863751 RepID=UPI0034CFE5F8